MKALQPQRLTRWAPEMLADPDHKELNDPRRAEPVVTDTVCWSDGGLEASRDDIVRAQNKTNR
jgi:hypothetical protein